MLTAYRKGIVASQNTGLRAGSLVVSAAAAGEEEDSEGPC